MQTRSDLWRAALTAWLLAVLCQVYLGVNHIPNVWLVGAGVAIAVLSALSGRLWPRWRGVGLAGAGVIFVLLWPFMVASSSLGRAWRQLCQALPHLGQTHGVNVPVVLTAALLLLLLGLLGWIAIYWRQPLWAWLVVVAYVLLVHVVNGGELLAPVAQLLVLAAAFHGGTWQAVSLRLAFSCALVALVVVGLPHLTPSLAKATVSVRTWLNTQGLYERLNTIKAGPSRTGFSDNDENLGGPLFDDNSAVFTVTEAVPQYLRVEAKSVYTGRGWTAGATDPDAFSGAVAGREFKDASAEAYGTAVPITITAPKATRIIGLPNGAITNLKTTPQTRHMYYDSNAVRLYPETPLKTLTFTLRPKTPSAAALRGVGTITAGRAWTQVPKRLPTRVRQLAQKVTAKAATNYDRAVAIERYLSTTADLTYSKTDTPKLPRGRDYVDYFLFTSHVGYCDNFSSAMVMMLRSIGVPARWAKGFNQGTKTGPNQYTITNANAHSWPEVYFGPTYGWVDFEPTSGFGTSKTAAPTTSSSQSSASSQTASVTSSSATAKAKAKKVKKTASRHHENRGAQWLFVVGGLVLVAGLVAARRRLVANLALIGLSPGNFTRRYRWLLWSLQSVVRRPASQPLGAFAQLVDAKLETHGAFAALTSAYEAHEFGRRTSFPEAEFKRVVHALTWRHRKHPEG